MLINNRKKGQSVLEFLVAMTVFVLVVSSIMFLVLDSQEANRQGSERTQAALLSQEGIEAAKSLANRGWKYLLDGSHGLDRSQGSWEWSGNSNIIDNKFTRRIIIEPVYRDANGDIIESGGSLDRDTKKVTAQVSWNFTTLRPSEILATDYLTNWRSLNWIQTTQNDFDQGSFNNTKSTLIDDGEIQLSTITITGLAAHDWRFDNSDNYLYNPAKIEVSNSQARLLDTGSNQASSANPGFNSGESPWQYFDWSQDIGDPDTTGRWRSYYGNPGGGVRIRIPRDNNYQTGGYYQLPFTITESYPSFIDLDFDWRISAFRGTPQVFEIYAFVDNFSGDPFPGSEVWASGPVHSTSGWSSVHVDLTALLATPGTYYLKLAAWASVGSRRAGAFAVRFDNAAVSWATSQPVYPTDRPSIVPAVSFSSPDIVRWRGFRETATKNGGEIYYELSNDGGATWRAWRNNSWRLARITDNNTASIVNAHISRFSASSQQIMFKAYLSSDGSQQVALDNIRIIYESSGTTQYMLSGTYDSQAFDSGSLDTVYNFLDWQADEPNPAYVEFQIKTAADQAGLSTAVWAGPDGTSGTYYTNSGTVIVTDSGASGQRWIQWRAYLYSDGTVTPTIRQVSINYD